MNTICLVLDCLHTGFLGPYGNSWIDTPAFDRLASQAFTLDCALVDSPRLDRLYDSYWHVKHALAPTSGPGASFPARVREAGLAPILMTDDGTVSAHPLAVEFDQIVAFDSASPRKGKRLAAHLEETYFASCFAQLVDWLDRAPRDFFLWCHLGSLGRIWDAPMEYRTAYSSPGDPEPYLDMTIPRRQLQPNYDPDELFGIVQAYSGQVSLLDACLAGLLGMLDDCPLGEDTALAVLGSRGFPLGEHLQVGLDALPLYGELIQTPALVRLPDGCGAAARSPELVQPADLSATLLELVGAPTVELNGPMSLLPIIRGEADTTRECVVLAGANAEHGLRTPAWYFRRTESPELFVKPDDRWEANNVASRCAEVVEQFDVVLAQFSQATSNGYTSHTIHLPDILTRRIE